MIINGNIEIFDKSDYSTYAALLHNNRTVFSFIADHYRNSLNLIRGLIGGGYINSTIYTQITKIQFSTDAWTTAAQQMNYATKYGGWASALSNGYVMHNQRNGWVYNDRVNFATESVAAIANRNYGPGSPASVQHGIGYLPVYSEISSSVTAPSGSGNTPVTTYNTLASYGTKAYQVGNGGSWESLTFSNESWTALSGGVGSADGVGWFDKDYSWAYFSTTNHTVTYRMSNSAESWSSISTTSSPGALGMPSSGAEKGVNSKRDKFYMAGNWGGSYCGGSDGNRIFKFVNSTSTWSVNTGSQTRWNNEHSGMMGMNFGYFAGGYNCTDGQNAHTDKINYDLDTIVQITDAPRQLSSASPMWSSI